ncbi:putative phage abortive infection protein [Methylobacterium sp. Leaf456]|uniref:putative phage abortive infection protein n=1 Tax=Methylobacterium sp. Leaf456 TaxID=1736382 RepID=UPI00138ECA46
MGRNSTLDARHTVNNERTDNNIRKDDTRKIRKYAWSVFQAFFTILYRIKNEPNITEEEKFSYGNLVRGQLSQYEVALAGLNGLSNVSKDFRDLITYFIILKYTTGTRRKVLLPHYKESAFSGRSK